MKNKVIIPAAAALVLGAGALGVAQFASADTSASPSVTSTAAPGSSNQDGRPDRGHGPGKDKGMMGVDTAKLATKLGVDEAKLKTAIETVQQALKPTAKPTDGTKPTEADRTAREAAFAEALAKELGIDKAKVTDALTALKTEAQASMKEAFKAKLDQAVKDGKLTQAEADAVIKAADAGVIGMGGRGPR